MNESTHPLSGYFLKSIAVYVEEVLIKTIKEKMNKHTLYIIGNGFDISHYIESEYRYFYEYLLKYHYRFLSKIGDIYPQLSHDERYWADFEKELSRYSIASDIVSVVMEEMGTLESSNNYPDGEIDYGVIDAFTDDKITMIKKSVANLKEYFNNWISETDISKCIPKFKLNKESIFLTFNYTRTLEQVYKIKEKNILHIHGRVGDEELIIGHRWNAENEENAENEDSPVIIEKIQKVIDALHLYNNNEMFSLIDPIIKDLFYFSSVIEDEIKKDSSIESEVKLLQVVEELEKECVRENYLLTESDIKLNVLKSVDKLAQTYSDIITLKESFPTVESVIMEKIRPIVAGLEKKCEDIIGDYDDFFENLDDITEVVIIGHSLSEVDMPYFQKISEILNNDVVWNIGCYYSSEDDKNEKMKYIDNVAKQLALKKNNYKMFDVHAPDYLISS